MSLFLPKDFIETKEGLIFAVVSAGKEEQRVISFLRYQRSSCGCRKLSTKEANALLSERWPEYLYYSKIRDVRLHGVPGEKITYHHQPRRRLMRLWKSRQCDSIEHKVKLLLGKFYEHGLNPQHMGITGSILIGAQNPDSDIDLVFYRRDSFFKAREVIKRLLSEGILHNLDDTLWHDAYKRRRCSLTFSEFLWHEQRKYNKAAIQQTKFDISLLTPDQETNSSRYRKCGTLCLKSQIVDDTQRFDYPARYRLDHPSIKEVVSYTATYAGQARHGESVEVHGVLETSTEGYQRILVGTDREASGDYIKVLSTL
ncbi:MAG: hypothetical protein GY792_31805 [Gammaproteobacteria bacterium]|nr:hypothetical protein [Gammaproteobacteria bacterium]